MAYLEACSVDTAADDEYDHSSQKDPKLHQLHFVAPRLRGPRPGYIYIYI
jgi:hypothetical protein